MLRIRVKMGPQRNHHNNNNSNMGRNNNKEFTCCFGLHVHTVTIMIGLWHLFLNILALSLLAVIWRNPHMMEELDSGSYDYSVDLNAPALPTPLSKVDPPYAYRDHSLNYRKRYQNFDMGGLVCTCMIAITLMMIYGTLKGKPSHLLPFFCLQLFDFAITTLTAAGYLCYLQAIHRIIAESHRLPWREKLLELSPEELVVVVLVVFVCIVFLKAYAIGIVWRCYKYLSLRQQTMRAVMSCVLTDIPGGSNFNAEERAYSTLLPNYDEAIAQYMKHAPPPSYQVAMSNYQSEAVAAGVSAGAGVVVAGAAAAEALMDNNNDTPNNNNTVHVNANTPPMRRMSSSSPPASPVGVHTPPLRRTSWSSPVVSPHSAAVAPDFDIETIDAAAGHIAVDCGDEIAAGIPPPPAYNDTVDNAAGTPSSPSRTVINIPGQVSHYSVNESQA